MHLLSTFFAFSLLISKKRLKGKGNELLYLSLSFCIIIFILTGSLIWGSNMSKKDTVSCIGCSCALVVHAFFLHLKQVLVPIGCVASGGCQLPTYSVLDIACLPCSHSVPLNSHGIMGAPESCALGASWVLHVNREVCILYPFPLLVTCSIFPSNFTLKHNFKNKTINNLKMVKAKH